jgi:hypothetical protein
LKAGRFAGPKIQDLGLPIVQMVQGLKWIQVLNNENLKNMLW